MFTRVLTRSYVVPVSDREIWAHLTDPVAVAAASSHPVRVDKPEPGFAVGSWWDEHHGAECDFDVVRWRVLAVEPARSVTVESRQSGARQRVTQTLSTVDGGVEIRSTLELGPSPRGPGGVGERLVMLLVTTTGLGFGAVEAEFDRTVQDDLAHFGALPRL